MNASALRFGVLVGVWITVLSARSAELQTLTNAWDGPAVSEIRLVLDESAMSRLRADPRRYVPAEFRADNNHSATIGVHLKGSVGSFRPLDDKPSLTFKLDRYSPGFRWRGTSKVHLNNSLEDPSYLCEWLGGEIFRSVGIEAPRVAHAVVWFNGRRLGLYVLKEGFTDEFLQRTSPESDGTILEPAVGHDLDGKMAVRAGRRSGMPKKSSVWLESLVNAANEPDPANRWIQLGFVLEVDQFLTFLAVESLLAHRDGYGLARNNYRIQLDRTSGRARWLPHGMDQLFQPPDLPWLPSWAGRLARAVMDCPEGRTRYETIFNRQLTEVLEVSVLTNRLNQAATELLPTLSAHEAKALLLGTSELCYRIAARRASLDDQQNAASVAAVEFVGNCAALTGWSPQDLATSGRVSEVVLPDGTATLQIQADSATSAAWGKRVRLVSGHYRFEGRVRTRGVEPLGFGRNHGAALRVSGSPSRSVALLGDTSWHELAVELVVGAEETVDLLCELRASAGEVWFDLKSLRLRRLE